MAILDQGQKKQRCDILISTQHSYLVLSSENIDTRELIRNSYVVSAITDSDIGGNSSCVLPIHNHVDTIGYPMTPNQRMTPLVLGWVYQIKPKYITNQANKAT